MELGRPCMHKPLNYKFDELVIELTRKCNFSCGHCIKGDAQNADMSDAVMDAFFSKAGTVCHLSLGSGEVGLVPERIEKLTETLRKHGTFIKQVYLYTNASKVEGRFIDALKELEQYVIDVNKNHKSCDILRFEDHFPIMPPMLIDISIDKYHVKELQRLNISVEQFKENVIKIKEAFPGKVRYFTNYATLYNEGRAVDIPWYKANKLNNNSFRLGKAVTTNETYVVGGAPYADKNGSPYTRKVVHVAPYCMLTYDGRLSDSQRSYQNEDLIAKGNILTDDIADMLKEHDLWGPKDDRVESISVMSREIRLTSASKVIPFPLELPVIAVAKISSAKATAPYKKIDLGKREPDTKLVPPQYPDNGKI